MGGKSAAAMYSRDEKYIMMLGFRRKNVRLSI